MLLERRVTTMWSQVLLMAVILAGSVFISLGLWYGAKAIKYGVNEIRRWAGW
jgi:hypothetical protein